MQAISEAHLKDVLVEGTWYSPAAELREAAGDTGRQALLVGDAKPQTLVSPLPQTAEGSVSGGYQRVRPGGTSPAAWWWQCHRVLRQLLRVAACGGFLTHQERGPGRAWSRSLQSRQSPVSLTPLFDNDPLMERIKVGSLCLAAVLHALPLKTGFGEPVCHQEMLLPLGSASSLQRTILALWLSAWLRHPNGCTDLFQCC